MTENRENWLYPDASGLYFPHDGFIMRATDGKQYDYEEECELLNEYHKGYVELKKQNKELKKENEDLYENDKSLRKMMGNMTHNFQGVSVKEDLFNEVLKVLKEIGADDLYDDLWKTSIDTGVNGC